MTSTLLQLLLHSTAQNTRSGSLPTHEAFPTVPQAYAFSLALALLSILSARQKAFWNSSYELSTHTIEVAENNPLAEHKSFHEVDAFQPTHQTQTWESNSLIGGSSCMLSSLPRRSSKASKRLHSHASKIAQMLNEPRFEFDFRTTGTRELTGLGFAEFWWV